MAVDGSSGDGPPEGQRAVKMTLNLLDYIGFIAKNYWDIEDDFARLAGSANCQNMEKNWALCPGDTQPAEGK